MEDIKSQLANRLKEAYNVLITVSTNPTIDQLSAAIGMTLMLNKLGKHATTVFSGATPPMLEFLHPEKTIEKNTDSLRDFIISLDKAKADKLRYKIEDQFVKIFITPYHTSINEKDLVFSQGDFNVDVVVAIGVHRREELDNVITTHGRILHDATVSTVNTAQPSTLGSINWSDKNSSSLCEMMLYLSDLFGNPNILDVQIANALLTGIVAETQRFSNQKTTSLTMSASSRLLAAGGNQQLVASQLQPPQQEKVEPKPEVNKPAQAPPNQPDDKGVIRIDHTSAKEKTETEKDKHEEENSDLVQVQIDEQGTLKTLVPDQPMPTGTAQALPDKPAPDSESNKGKVTKVETAATTPGPGSYMNTPPKDADEDFLGSPDAGEDQSAKSDTPPLPLLSHDGPQANANDGSAPASLDKLTEAVNAAAESNPDQEFMAPIESLNAQALGRPSEEKAQTDSVAAPVGGDPNGPIPPNQSNLPPPPVPPPVLPPPAVDRSDQAAEAI